MMSANVGKTIEEIIKQYASKEFSMETDLIECGIIDSLTLVEIIIEIENRVGIAIDLDCITIENFSTMRSIERVVLELIDRGGNNNDK